MAVKFRKSITISSSSVDETLTNFPLLVRIVGDADIGSKAQPSGSDLRFGDIDAAQSNDYYFHDIQTYTVTDNSASALIWVNVPTINSGSDTTIYMFYGDAESSDISSGSAVFSSYEMVIRADSGSTTVNDVSNGPISEWTSEAGLATADGIIETALSTGAGIWYTTTSSGAQELWGGLESASLSMWLYRDGTNNEPFFDNEFGSMWHWTSGDSGYLGFNGSYYGLGSSYSSTSETEPGLFSPRQAWVHYTYTRASSSIRVFRNGEFFESFTSSLSTHPAVSGRLGFGTFSFGSNRWDGRIEDARISHDVKSDAWLKFQFQNTASGSITFGPETAITVIGAGKPITFSTQGNTITLSSDGNGNTCTFT